jgi:Cupin
MPTLWGEGIALVQINLEACGINTLHTHPRSSEFTYVVSGEKVSMDIRYSYVRITLCHECIRLRNATVLRCTLGYSLAHHAGVV